MKTTHSPIAIIGMAAIYPQAKNLREYWENNINKTDCTTENPPEKTENAQLLSLIVAKQALKDARYLKSTETHPANTGIILAITGKLQLTTTLATNFKFKLGGINLMLETPNATSSTAIQMALSELIEYRSDMMITGGVNLDNSPSLGMLVLKRLTEAKRDKNRIYAIIAGIGTDTENASIAPIDLIETHETDEPTEIAALKTTFSEKKPLNSKKSQKTIALGSVKSQIAHTQAAADAASLIKIALALHHKIFPPTLTKAKPKSQFRFEIEDSPFYLNTQTRPWICAEGGTPWRACLSAFGASHNHLILEEYENEQIRPYRLHNTPASILLFAQTPAQLLENCLTTLAQLQSDARAQHYAQLIKSSKSLKIPLNSARVGIVINALGDARESLQMTIDLLKNKPMAETWEHPKGIYYRQKGIDAKGKIVALFPGQRSQYLEMGRKLVLNFPPLRQAYAQIPPHLKYRLPSASAKRHQFQTKTNWKCTTRYWRF